MKTVLYPVVFTPIYKEMIWGGARLANLFNRTLPGEKVGESWDISCRPGEMGVVANGDYAGETFETYIAKDRVGILGTRLANLERFPLLVKIIDANDALSIQVHPDDVLAQQAGSADSGKSEMWYVLNPPHDGRLIIGLKPGVTREKLATAYKNGTVEDCLNYMTVKTGDMINIPAGLVHALTPGIVVAEVQQNSDITYRLYDYNRMGLDGKPRDLHVKEALAVSDFDERIPKEAVVGLPVEIGENTLTYAICNPNFAIIKYDIALPLTEASNPAAFSIFTCVDGRAVIKTDTMAVEIPKGGSVFIPASVGMYTIAPAGDENTVLLKSFVPDMEADFIAPLLAYGYSMDVIQAKTSLI
ncbi:MAG: class I mannose-6-phosphate isomerase [Defluviitaleaceae bacterium]|nr:class I mannose-6-phosphate isomerase [Defluviitaleaceae bacterium]